MPEGDGQGISRRDLLKRGFALGGAVVWATPVVQTLGMGRAFAQAPSGQTSSGESNGHNDVTQVAESTAPQDGTTTNTTSNGGHGGVGNETPGGNTMNDQVGGIQVEGGTGELVKDPVTVTTHQVTTQEGEDQVTVAAGQLPFTGLHTEQLLPLAGALVATGAVATRLARQRDRTQPSSGSSESE